MLVIGLTWGEERSIVLYSTIKRGRGERGVLWTGQLEIW